MTLPLIPIAAGLAATGAGAALNAWLTGDTDPWSDKAVFNARMRDMHGLAVAINTGFSTCAPFRANKSQLAAWRAVRDGLSKFYGDVGVLHYSSPSTGEIEQAKSYASKLYFWTGEYNRLKCGAPVSETPNKAGKPATPVDPYSPVPPPNAAPPVDWAGVVKWSAIGIGGAFLLKTLTDLFRDVRASRY